MGFTYKDFEYDDFKYDDWSYDDYQESEQVKKYQAALDNHNTTKPGEYQSKYQSIADDVLNKYMNREKFSYDLNGDALYQQYKDKYITQGKMAMQDTMAQAAAMTGGYGNSYAASVGNQAYQASLQNLNDVVPELYQMAYDRYNQEGQDMLNQYGIYMDRENMEYGRYRDSVSDWNAERDYLTNLYNAERDYDYSKYSDNRNFDYSVYSDNRNFAYNQYSDNRNLAQTQYNADRSLAYDDYRNGIADEQWQKTFDQALAEFNYQQSRDAIADQQWNKNYSLQERQVKASEKSADAAKKSADAAEKAKQYAISNYSSVPDSLRKKIDTMMSSGYKMQGNMPLQVWQNKNAATINKSVGNYLDGMVASGEMSPQVAAALMREYYIEE